VILQSQTAGATTWTDVKTIAANACDDFTVDSSLTYRGSATVGGNTVTGDEKQVTAHSPCNFEGIIWIIPDTNGNPTIDGVTDDATCTGTDIFLLNYCVGQTLDGSIVDGSNSQAVATGIAYNGGSVLSNNGPNDVSGAGEMKLSNTQVTVELCYNSNEVTTTGKAMYYICAGDSTAGFKGYKVISTSGGTIGEIVQTTQSGTKPTCSGVASLFIWTSLAFTLAHLF